MIAHVFPSYPAVTGRPLGTYILDLKNENEHKVEWDRTVNTNADTPAAAISAIEEHNARNLRYHTKSRWVHVVISFPEGEKPTHEQMNIIEDRLMDAIGFGDHPRLAALHKPDGKEVTNWHYHIGVSRIDPTTLKAKHPRHNHFSLQAEAARIEIDLGLRQERKTLLPRERKEIERRLEWQRELDNTPTHLRGFSRETLSQKAEDSLRKPHPMPDKLSAAAFASQIASDTHQTLPPGHDSFMLQCPNGSEHAHGDKNRSLHVWEGRSGGHAYCQTDCSINDIGGAYPGDPAAKGKGFDSRDWAHYMGREVSREPAGERVAPKALTPAQERDRVNRAAWERLNTARDRNPELPDEARFFLASEPAKPASSIQVNDERLARKDAEWWKGQITKDTLMETQRKAFAQTRDREPEGIWRKLPHEATRAEWTRWEAQQREIAKFESDRLNGKIPSPEHMRESPRQDLFKEYKAERDAVVEARKAAENDVYQRFGQYRQDQRQFYQVQHETHKLEVIHRRERHLGHDILKAQERGDRVEARRLLTQELAAARQQHQVLSWTRFLEREAGQGNQEASRLLQKQRTREMQQGLER